MALIDELKERADKLDAELLALSGRMKEVERESDAVHICINALDIAEMDAEEEALGPIDLPAEPAPINPQHYWEVRHGRGSPIRWNDQVAAKRYYDKFERAELYKFDPDTGYVLVAPKPEAPADTFIPIEAVREDQSNALAEFMQRPGAVKWELGVTPEPAAWVLVDMLFESGRVAQGTRENWYDVVDDDGRIIAYAPIISQPTDQSEEGLGHTLIGMGYGEDDPTAVAIAAYIEAENASITQDPELQAAVERAEATLAAAEPALPTMDDIIDPDFTGGLKTEEYLDRLHAGTLDFNDTFRPSRKREDAL